MSGANPFTGATTIGSAFPGVPAALEVDGSLKATTSVAVNAGGTLSGTGIVDPTAVTVATGGTLAPGNPANPTGTLTIDGNLLFNSGSFYTEV